MPSNSITAQQEAAARAIQHAAAHSITAQARLVAGPGTGKSAVIEERVRWLLDAKVDPTSIAVVSFTRASALDLQLRIRSYCTQQNQDGADQVSITTLHSLALRVLRAGGLLHFYPVNPLVLDDWELANVYDAEFGQSQGISSKSRREEIRRFYEALWSTGAKSAPSYIPPKKPVTPTEEALFIAFHQPTAQVYSCVLPGEILRKCVDATKSGSLNIAGLLRLTHLIVDEYQDLNPADLEFVDQMAAGGVTIFVAGDDDQSIYSFRHASPQGIQRFHQTYSGASTPTLSHCFRCTPVVLSSALSLITNNAAPGRIQKQLVSLYAASNPQNPGVVHRWKFGNAQAEAKAIADSCTALITAGICADDILILLATRDPRVAMWPLIQKALSKAKLPFEPPKEEGFVDSDPGRLVLAIVRIICSRDQGGVPQDFVAHRVVLGMKSGVGVGTCDSIRQAVLTTANVSFRDLFYPLAPTMPLNARARSALDHARVICGQITTWARTDIISQRTTELRDILAATIDPAAAATWDQYYTTLVPQMTIEELRDYLSADNDQQRASVVAAVQVRLGQALSALTILQAKVRVMTMHGAKGLSAKVVFIPGLEDGILPNLYQKPYPAQILEAARLLYVSITRARAACMLSYVKYRSVYGGQKTQSPSQFTMQTGGAFTWQQGGLSPAEVAAIRDSINLL